MEKDSLVHLTCYDPSDLWSLIFIRIIPKEHTLKNITKMKKWSLQWTQFMQLRKEAWKKIQDFNGVWTRDLAIPVRCSTNWTMKPLTLGAGQLSVCQTSDLKCLISEVWCQVSDFRRLMSAVCCETSEVRSLISDAWCQLSDFRRLISNVWFQMCVVRRLILGVQYPISDVWCQVSDFRWLISDVWCPVLLSDVWCQVSVVRRLISDAKF